MFEISRLSDRDSMLYRFGFDGTGSQFTSASGRAVRLAVDRHDLCP